MYDWIFILICRGEKGSYLIQSPRQLIYCNHKTKKEGWFISGAWSQKFYLNIIFEWSKKLVDEIAKTLGN